MSGIGVVNLVVSIPITSWVMMRIDDDRGVILPDTAEEYTQHEPEIDGSESTTQFLG